MFVRKTIQGIILIKGRNDTYDPPTGQSSRWKHWMTEQDSKVFSACEAMQGKITACMKMLTRCRRCILIAVVKLK